MIRILALCAMALLLSLASLSTARAQEVKLAVTDLVGLEQLQREFGAFVEVLERASGYDIAFFPVSNRTAAAEALRFRKVDFVLTGPAEYVVINKRTKATPVVGFSRPDYFSVVFVLADSQLRSLDDLRGKKIVLGSLGSTSKHLGPMQVLADAGLEPAKDVTPVHTKLPQAWEALKRGDVAAVGMTNDKFLKLRRQEHEAGGLQPGAFRVLGRGRDLPNDVLMAGAHVDAATIARVKQAFTSQSDDLVAAILQGEDNTKYRGMVFLPGIAGGRHHHPRGRSARPASGPDEVQRARVRCRCQDCQAPSAPAATRAIRIRIRIPAMPPVAARMPSPSTW